MEKRREKICWISVFSLMVVPIFLSGCQSQLARQAPRATGKGAIEGSLEVITKEGKGEQLRAEELGQLEARRRVGVQRTEVLGLLEKKQDLEEKTVTLEPKSSDTLAAKSEASSKKEEAPPSPEPTLTEKSSPTPQETAPSEAASKEAPAALHPPSPPAESREYWLESKYPHMQERIEPDDRHTLFYRLRHRGGVTIQKVEIIDQRLVVTTERVDLKTLIDLLQSWLSEEGKITTDKERNMLIIRDDPEHIELAKELLLKVFDTPERQVLIEANVFEHSRDWDFQLGQRWTTTRFRSMKAAFQDFTTDFGIPGGIHPPWVGSKGTVEFLLASDNWGVELDVVIDFLQEQGWVNAIATPREVTQEGKTATIEIGEELPVVTQVQVQRGQLTSKTEFKFVGVKLFVTPLIVGDKAVKLHIIAEVSQVVSFEVIGTENPIPIARIDTRLAETTVTVRDGRTLIMGGLTSDEEMEREVKIPLLGDIPFIGWLFKGYRKAKIKKNLVFTVKPTIIKEPIQAEMVMPAPGSP